MKFIRSIAASLIALALLASGAQAQVVQSLSNLISVTRAQTVTSYCTDSNDLLVGFAANTARVCSGTGLLVESAATNLFTRSNEFDNASWQQVGTITRTPAYATSPDGTTNAYRANNTFGVSSLYLNVNVTSAQAYTVCMWAKTNGGGNTFRLFGDNNQFSTNFTATSSWQRFSYTYTAASTALKAHGFTRDSSDNLFDLQIFGAQMETGTSCSSYIPTTTVSVTRNADGVVWSAAPSSVLAGSAYSVIARVSGYRNGVRGAIIGDNPGGHQLSLESTGAGLTSFGSGALLTANTGTNSGTNTLGLAGSTSRSLVLNGGTVATEAVAATTSGQTYKLGSTAGGTVYANGYIQRVTLYASRLADATLQAGTVSGANVPLGYALDLNFATGSYVSSGAILLARTPAPALSLDFANGYYVSGNGPSIAKTTAEANVLSGSTTGGYAENRTDGSLTWKYGPVNNQAIQTDDISNPAWTKTNATTGGGVVIGPVASAKLLLDNVTNGPHEFTPVTSYSVTSGVSYTLSMFVRGNTLTRVRLGLPTATFTANARAFFDTTTAAFDNIGVAVTSTNVTPVDGGYRVSITAPATATSPAVLPFITLVQSGTVVSYIGSGQGLYIGGIQFETTPYPTASGPAPYCINGASVTVCPAQLRLGAGNGLGSFDAVTNMNIRAQEFTSSWTQASITVTTDAAAAPDGTMTADLIDIGVANASHGVTSAAIPTFVSGSNYVMSIFVRAGTGRYFQIFGNTLGSVFNTTQYSNFDTTGCVTGTVGGGAVAAYATQIGSYCRFSLVAQAGATASGQWSAITANGPSMARAGSYTGANETYWIWGAMTHLGSFPMPYCPTAAAPFTCSADLPLATGTLNGLLNSSIISTSMQLGPTPVAGAVFSLLSPSGSTTSYLGRSTANGFVSARAGGRTIASAGLTGLWSTGSHKVCTTSDGTTIGIAADGSAVATQNGVLGTTSTNYIGNRGGIEYLNGYIQKLNVWTIPLGASCQPVSLNFLLERDLNPASNDNHPVGLARAA